MGWEPATVYSYDESGRLIESRPEPEWDDTQRAGMIGLAEYRATEQCPTCGGPKWVCQAPEAETGWEAALPSRCHITTTVRRAQKAYADSNPAAFPEALSWGARRKQATTAGAMPGSAGTT